MSSAIGEIQNQFGDQTLDISIAALHQSKQKEGLLDPMFNDHVLLTLIMFCLPWIGNGISQFSIEYWRRKR